MRTAFFKRILNNCTIFFASLLIKNIFCNFHSLCGIIAEEIRLFCQILGKILFFWAIFLKNKAKWGKNRKFLMVKKSFEKGWFLWGALLKKADFLLFSVFIRLKKAFQTVSDRIIFYFSKKVGFKSLIFR